MATSEDTIKTASASPQSSKPRGLLEEVATRARSIDFYYFGGFLPNPDPVLKKMGKDQLVYDEILGDAHLSSVIASRSSGVKALMWDIDKGKAKSRQAKIIIDVFKKMDIERIMTEILEANYRGFQPLEVLWAQPNGEGFILPVDVLGKPPEWFQFNELNELRFRSLLSLLGEAVEDRKFLLPRRKPTYKNPYGDALLSKCFWPVKFKRSGLEFWITFVEKFGIPFMVGKLPRGAAQAEYDKLTTNLENMVRDAVAAIPDDSSVEILEPQGKSSSGNIFSAIIDWANAEISKAIVGHAGASDSTPGKLGGEDNASEVRGHLIDEDKRLVERTLNELIKWIFEVNFGTGEVPEFYLYSEEEVDVNQATRDKTLSDMGVEFSKEYIDRKYGFEEGDVVAVSKPAPAAAPGLPAKPGKPGEFSERAPKLGDQDAIDNYVDNLQAAVLREQADGFLKPVIALIKAGKSYEDILDNLAVTFTEMDSSNLQKMLQRAIFVAEMVGQATGNK